MEAPARRPKGLTKNPTPKRPRTSIRRDKVDPRDYVKYVGVWSCEDCSHFAREKDDCTIGYHPSNHKRDEQKRQYETTGTIAFCRFHEAD